MSTLYFRFGKLEGFTSSSLSDKKEGYAVPIRELLQNSLDASHQAGNDKCEVDIYIEEIPMEEGHYAVFAAAGVLGRLPTVEEYMKEAGELNNMAAEIYRHLNFNEMAFYNRAVA